jgi:hypothetical protein
MILLHSSLNTPLLSLLLLLLVAPVAKGHQQQQSDDFDVYARIPFEVQART